MILNVNIDDAVESLFNRQRVIERNVLRAVQEGARQVARRADENARELSAKQVSRQDGRQSRRLRFFPPVKMVFNQQKGEALLLVGAFLVRARLPEVRQIYEATGHGDRLLRKSLTIRRLLFDGRGGRKFDEPTRFRFRDHAWLQKWGERQDRGEQIRRHVIRLSGTPGAQVRLQLVLEPALEQEGPKVLSRIRDAAGRRS